GLMPLDIEGKITEALVAADILVDPQVTVTIAEFASRPVNVAGAVKRPVTFQADGKTTLLDAITRAEGLSVEAGHEILVTRPGKNGAEGFTQRVRVQDLIERADP